MLHEHPASAHRVPGLRVLHSPGRWLLGALIGSLLVAFLTAGVRPADGVGYSPVIEEPAAYEGQRTCVGAPLPGTVELARWLTRTYKGTGSMGLIRGCRTGGRSEHKDGRAFDWAAEVTKKRTKRAAYRFIRAALATDAAGNRHALARRMGIMYLIYNDTIWSSSYDFAPRPYLHPTCPRLKGCSRTLRHRNHVHISLGYAGASGQTSWYRGRGVAAVPVLYPGTTELDPAATAVTGLDVPATGQPVTSSYVLRAGVTYRVVVTGTVGYGAGVTGDANCVADPSGQVPVPRGALITPDPVGGPGLWGWWSNGGSHHPASAFASPVPGSRGLLVNGVLPWDPTSCRPDHTYEAWITPTSSQPLQVLALGTAPGEGTGRFRVYVARDDITLASLAG